jgi:hypothetical protein
MDDEGVNGLHTLSSSIFNRNDKWNLKRLTENKTGLGAIYKLSERIMKWKIDLKVSVTKRIPSKEKVWETMGENKLKIFSWFLMHLRVTQDPVGSKVELIIQYKRPKGFINKVFSFLLADWFCKRCLRYMLGYT